MNDIIKEILVDEETLRARVAELGTRISEAYRGEEVTVVAVLKGAVVFFADLIRHIDGCVTTDFLACSSYGGGTESSGQVRLIKDLDRSVEGRHVLIVEDIIDTGTTLHYLMENLKARQAKSVKLVALLDKPDRRKVDVHVDYVGFTIPDEFVVGYGLDYAERYRELPYIGILKEEVYT